MFFALVNILSAQMRTQAWRSHKPCTQLARGELGFELMSDGKMDLLSP